MPIRKTQGGYKIDKVKGKSKSKADAKKRLKAVKANQAKRKKPMSKKGACKRK